MQHRRDAAVEGMFYPKDCESLKIYFQEFNNHLDIYIKDKPIFKITPRAIIVPHAGYVYSGFTANIAYFILSKSKSKRVIVIGPSHHQYLDGVSGSFFESYETPCGDIDIDTSYLVELAKQFEIKFEPNAHKQEHSTEVQMPFVQHYLPEAKVIELIYGNISSHLISEVITYLLKDKDNIVVISTDLSHFYTQDEALRIDAICLEGIASLDNQKLDQGCEACGLIGIKAIIESANLLGLKSQLIDYRTSADYSGDESRVVGYVSAMIY